VAEDKDAKAASSAAAPAPAKKPIGLYALVVLNMLVVGAVGFMVQKASKKPEAEATLDKVIQGEAHKQEADEHKEQEFLGKLVPLEMFLVNLSGTRGNKLLKVVMELEVDNDKVQEEIDKRKPQIRDIIIILLSSKSYATVSTPEGKETLRDEIKDTLNSFLTQGKVKRVLFTEFIFN
jgi:flagellar FliL protein